MRTGSFRPGASLSASCLFAEPPSLAPEHVAERERRRPEEAVSSCTGDEALVQHAADTGGCVL